MQSSNTPLLRGGNPAVFYQTRGFPASSSDECGDAQCHEEKNPHLKPIFAFQASMNSTWQLLNSTSHANFSN